MSLWRVHARRRVRILSAVAVVMVAMPICLYLVPHSRISGFMFVTLQSGSSELVRGKEILLLRGTVPGPVAAPYIAGGNAIANAIRGKMFFAPDIEGTQLIADQRRLEVLLAKLPTTNDD